MLKHILGRLRQSRDEQSRGVSEEKLRTDNRLAESELDEPLLGRIALSQGWSGLDADAVLDRLGFESSSFPEAKARRSVLGVLRVGFASALFAASTLLVVGAILEGKSALFSENSFAALIILVILLILLGLFEGLQISVALLRLKDLDALSSTHPRAARLHRLFRSESGTRRFLAGRQFFVVFVVFFIARITTFSGLRTVPLLGWSLPSQLELLWYAAFDLGLLGAFVVLWIAQLAPQFGANKDPQGFLELPGMGLVLRSSIVVDDLGVTLPGTWLAEWVPEAKEIPNSQLERLRIAGETGNGIVASIVRRHISCSSHNTILRSKKHHSFLRGGFDLIEDESLLVDADQISDSRIAARLTRKGRDHEVTLEPVTTRVRDSTTLYSFRLSPRVGGFEAQDKLVISADITCGRISSHRIEITEVTRLLHVTIEFDRASFTRVSTVQVRRNRGNAMGFSTPEPQSLPFSENESNIIVEYFAAFPVVGEIVELSWSTI